MSHGAAAATEMKDATNNSEPTSNSRLRWRLEPKSTGWKGNELAAYLLFDELDGIVVGTTSADSFEQAAAEFGFEVGPAWLVGRMLFEVPATVADRGEDHVRASFARDDDWVTPAPTRQLVQFS